MRPSRFLVPTVLAGALLVACNGGDGPGEVEPEAFATDVCRAVGSLQTELEQAGADLSAVLEGDPGNLPAAKAALVDFLRDARELADDTAEAVVDAGVPAVDGGERVAEDLRQAIVAIREGFAAAQLDAEALPEDDPARFSEEAQELLTRFGETLQAPGPIVDDLQGQFDEGEFGEVEACRTLVTS